MGRGPKPAKSKEAKPPVARKSPKDDNDASVRNLEKRLAEALRDKAEAQEQQAATAEILRVIGASPTDVQPVFDAIVKNAVRLCDAVQSNVQLFDGERMHWVAEENINPEAMDSIRGLYPMRPDRSQAASRAVLARSVVHLPDVLNDSDYHREMALKGGWRSVLSVPMLKEGNPIGVITVARRERFSEMQIVLLQTFADQAVIAIENVRLFKELEEKNRALTDAHAKVTEALDQQTATSDILRVISQSQTDVQPVFDTIVRNAVRLCGASRGGVYRFDGEFVHSVAHDGYTAEQLEHWRATWPRPVTAPSLACEAIKTRREVRIADTESTHIGRLTAETRATLRARGARSALTVPMFRRGEVIGAISLVHLDVGAFSDTHAGLLRAFADQAVIAIENVRLFKEVEARNRDLTEALEQQTATAEILRVISSSPTDVQPVFDAIASSAARLCGTYDVFIRRLEGDGLRLVAHHGPIPASALVPVGRGFVSGRAVLERRIVHVVDVQATADELPEAATLGRQFGVRTNLGVPLLREGVPLGVILLRRAESSPFTDKEVALLQTFADQAVIAIENVRLFKELEASNRQIAEKSRQIEVASQHKSEFLANMSHELRTPLNAIIGFSEVLSEKMFGELNEKQEEYSKDIHASGQHLLSLINDILDLSKIEAGRMELELSDFHLPTALDSALTLVRERAGRRGIALQMYVDSRLGQIQADERKVRQVVLNLLSNAIKFTPEGGRIEVGAVLRDGSVEISVSDTGVGIAPEDQEAVFEEFRQVGTAEKKVEGTGLGLTLCRKFIELHGGRIRVKSQVGAGSTFTFTIPAKRDE